ncbi:MAG: amino acid ABC transporter substrate-binding protein [Chloroflexota bacterium]|nr:MAG: amino acid ABC transporter substrate-binding protein [Chloroflexota bacterium]
MRARTPLTLLPALALVLAACGGGATATPSGTPAASATPEVTAAATPDACAPENLETMTAGTLTIGADNPAFPPYFQPSDPAVEGSVWEFGEPTNGDGLEAATAYAVAEQLGFAADQVTWVPVPFNNAVQPGPKDFDLYLTQVSYSAERAEAVDLSDGYFDLNQAVVSLKDNPIADVTTVAGLKDFKLGAPTGTTSYQYIVDNIQPTEDPAVYDTLDAALQALTATQVDGIVVDLPTAFFMTAVQLEDLGTIVGSLPTAGEVEHFSILLNLDSPLTSCVNGALATLKENGTLAAIVDEWITGQGAPALQ